MFAQPGRSGLGELSGDGLTETATLVIAARPEMWSIVRTTARAIALQMDLSFDDLEDLRLAIAELCASCAFGALPNSICECIFTWSHDFFELACVVSGISPDVEALEARSSRIAQLELARQILCAVVDKYEISPVVNGVRSGKLSKYRSTSGL